MLAGNVEADQGRCTAVRLLLQVERGEDNRLSGTVGVPDAPDVRAFSGTLELMRAFEELVPAQGTDEIGSPAGADGAGRDHAPRR
jgi:hypothetical protein